MPKTVIINHAVQGCGKSTLSHCIMAAVTAAGLSCACHSTDDYFMQGDRYCFDYRKLPDYHRRNLQAFTDDLVRQVDVVICDNTNLVPVQAKVYTEAARQYGYRIILLDFPPRELQELVAAQLVTAEHPNAHGIPAKALQRALDTYRTFPVQLFDFDELISISPHAFHTVQGEIGKQVLARVSAH